MGSKLLWWKLLQRNWAHMFSAIHAPWLHVKGYLSGFCIAFACHCLWFHVCLGSAFVRGELWGMLMAFHACRWGEQHNHSLWPKPVSIAWLEWWRLSSNDSKLYSPIIHVCQCMLCFTYAHTSVLSSAFARVGCDVDAALSCTMHTCKCMPWLHMCPCIVSMRSRMHIHTYTYTCPYI